MSLPYFREFGWDAEVVTVDPLYADMPRDELLLKSIPADIKIHLVKAFSKKWTSKFGLGSIALRSLLFYKRKVSRLFLERKFDLIYFSTTQFPVCILGTYWKKHFNVPYVIDMQDPWHSDYYLNKPKHEQPSKYWFSYRLNKYLEPIAMNNVDGLISVSDSYVNDLRARYPQIKSIPGTTIPFGAFAPDLKIATDNKSVFEPILDTNAINVVYVGRGGADMKNSVSVLFKAFVTGLKNEPVLFEKIKFHFIGTSYAPVGEGKASLLPIAAKFGIDDHVIEITDRISFYHTLVTLQTADALFIPGSDDPKYSASKIHPYLLTKKPLLAIFNSKSPALTILNACGADYAYSYDVTTEIESKINDFLKKVINSTIGEQNYRTNILQKYSSEITTKLQCELFNQVIKITYEKHHREIRP
jgi:hypothetical protein